jgi:hypothetical protein
VDRMRRMGAFALLLANAAACMPAQRAYSFAKPSQTGSNKTEILHAMIDVGLRPSPAQCAPNTVYSAWIDTGLRGPPMTYDDREDTTIFRRYAVALPEGGGPLTVRMEAERCRLYAVVVTGTSPFDREPSCRPERVPGEGTCESWSAVRVSPDDQRELDSAGQKLERRIAARSQPPAGS